MALTGLPSKRSVELMAGDKPEQKRAAGELYEYLKRLDDSLRALGIAVPAPVSTTGYAAAPGGSLALPAGQKPLPPASGAQVAGFVVMLTDGRQAVIDPAYMDTDIPAILGEYWKTNGDSSPSTGAWTLGGGSQANGDYWLTIDTGGNPLGGAWFQNQSGPGSDWSVLIGGDDISIQGAIGFTATNPQSMVFLGPTSNELLSVVSDVPTEFRFVTFPDASGRIPILLETLVNEAILYTYTVDANTLNVNGDSITLQYSLTLVGASDLALGIEGADICVYTPAGSSVAEVRCTVMRIDATTVRCVQTVWEDGEPVSCTTGTETVSDMDDNPFDIYVANGSNTAYTMIVSLNKAPAP